MDVSQEQQEQTKQAEQQEPVEQRTADVTSAPGEPAVAPKKKRVVRKVLKIDEETISPRPSYWPIALALALVVLLVGVAINGVVVGIGVVLVVIAILGWSFERR